MERPERRSVRRMGRVTEGEEGLSYGSYLNVPDLLGLQRQHRGKVFGYCTVNPNFTDHALREIDLRIKEGMVGVKLAASRRANDRLLDPIAERAGKLGVPILHHIWQHRRREWPGQEASDAALRTRSSTEGQMRFPVVRSFVDVHPSGANRLGEPETSTQVASEDRGEQSVR